MTEPAPRRNDALAATDALHEPKVSGPMGFGQQVNENTDLRGLPKEVAALRFLRQRLLDLTKRNKLVNYKTPKNSASAIAVVDELSAEIFRILVKESRAMRFRAAESEDAEAEAEPEDDDLQTVIPILDYLELDDTSPASHHVDLLLQTRLSPERLDHIQRRIADKVELIREEQGINTLYLALGMLKYYESDTSDELRRAPLLLIPVELQRPSARSRYQLTATDDDVVLNTALSEYLKQSFGVTLTSLPEDATSIDVNGLFDSVRESIAQFPRWSIEADEIVLASFSFLKLVMYKDLEENEEKFAQHPLFRLLLEEGGESYGLPDDVQSLDLDRDRPPEQTSEVLDADSSQQRAIAAVARGHNLVIEGPPGTGKSQTIVNLIANALSENKTVLFVSEKRAALDVVHRRLQGVGLGEFSLELHSQKASKREVINGLKRSLDHTLVTEATQTTAGRNLPRIRENLSAYVKALHRKHEPLDMTVFEAVGRLAQVKGATVLQWGSDPDQMTAQQLEVAKDHLEQLAATAEVIGNPLIHPWRDSTLSAVGTLWGGDQQELHALLSGIAGHVDTILELASRASTECGAVPVESLEDALSAHDLAELLDAAPGAPAHVLQSEEWNSPPPQVHALIELGKRTRARRQTAEKRFNEPAFHHRHTPDVAIVERLHSKLYRMFVSDYRRVRRAWLSMRREGYRASMPDQAAHLRDLDRMKDDESKLTRDGPLGTRLFGQHWRGVESDWDSLDVYVRWVVRFREACVNKHLETTVAAGIAASGPSPGVEMLQEIAATARRLAADLKRVADKVGWPDDYLTDRSLTDIGARIRSMLESESNLAQWTAFLKAKEAAIATAGKQVVIAADEEQLPYAEIRYSLLASFLESWIRVRMMEDPALTTFEEPSHLMEVETFRALDSGVLKENRGHLVETLKQRSQSRLSELRGSHGWAFLTRQFAKQRGHAPVRRLLAESFEPIRAIKPCFMMSPLMVAQTLRPGDHDFDLVIFDEASQLTPQDGVGAVLRASQIAVVGDPKQLPPTSFFDKQMGDTGSSASGELEDFESILELYMAAGVPSAQLKWHYRSQHESLIAFSYANIYDFQLFTFPSADQDNRLRGLSFEYVANGVYLGQGLNEIEGRRVVDAVVEHVKRCPNKSLGVGTFNLRQQLFIQDELERRRREDESIEDFFGRDKEEPFFVKNLENLQGDERDVILLSVTYGPGLDTVVHHNFGPINGKNGWRRLNVLVTRARERLRVFSSMRGDQIDLTKAKAPGAQMLREFLLFAERGKLVNERISQMAAAESPFEREVLAELGRRGVRAVPQVGVGRYRVDIGVLDEEVDGRFICGIECDGVAYHSSETARDRDRLRDEVLRRMGWRIHRVWSTDWYKHRAGQVERLIGLINQSREEARAEARRYHHTRSEPKIPMAGGAIEPETPRAGISGLTAPKAVGEATSEPYVMAKPARRGRPEQILDTPSSVIRSLLLEVLRTEAPLHQADLFARVASAWGVKKVGSRIEAKFTGVLRAMSHNNQVEYNAPFVTLPSWPCKVRSRADTGIPGDRVPPSEYRAAIVSTLRAGPQFADALKVETRKLLGYNRTGSKIDACLTKVIDFMLADQSIGHSSAGLTLRQD